ncbi:MAG: NAD(P)-binding protein [Halobacteriovoraceae bacterium]|jgi:uncharacterized protein|nr:NAD(P)-binding protein [Halobacteriovoraceae bacterium]MBT5094477.1 NAD(P)-binding protein [Halobacteriovoraceae bacterium]
MGIKQQLNLPYNEDLQVSLRTQHPDMLDFRILSQSLDARGANKGRPPKYQYNVEIIKAGEVFEPNREVLPQIQGPKEMPLIVGAGPAGLFCALRLADHGVPCHLIERGDRANKRMIQIGKYWRQGLLNLDSNVCFGEGGAGLFSDGKLITRVKSPFVQYVLNRLVDFGAPKETAYLSNPHLGSNRIRQLISKVSDYLEEKGCILEYNTRMVSLLREESDPQKIVGAELADGRKIYSPNLVLAVGHSASEVYRHLADLKVPMKAKDFAIGVRMEHKRKLVDQIQLGEFANDPNLGAATYRLSHEDPTSFKGTYSFCMCPGGHVLSTGTDVDGIVINGMSNYSRSSPWSNAALVVSVKAGDDFPVDSILGGLDFQREVENRAYKYSAEHGNGWQIPAQRMTDFLKNSKGKAELPKSSIPSKTVSANLHEVLPDFVSSHLHKALLKFDHKLPGIIAHEGLLLAPESRTSAPLTILRDRESLESTMFKGLYPIGEGAGYAGGITSAAVDGVKAANSLLSPFLD